MTQHSVGCNNRFFLRVVFKERQYSGKPRRNSISSALFGWTAVIVFFFFFHLVPNGQWATPHNNNTGRQYSQSNHTKDHQSRPKHLGKLQTDMLAQADGCCAMYGTEIYHTDAAVAVYAGKTGL